MSSLQLQSIPSFNQFVVNFVTRLKSAPLFNAPSLQQAPLISNVLAARLSANGPESGPATGDARKGQRLWVPTLTC